MKALIKLVLIFFAGSSLLTSSQAIAYGREGHQAIAEAARTFLTSQTLTSVKKILGTDDLASVAVWADELKQARKQLGPLAEDPEATQFNQLFPENGKWHFLDLPLGTSKYTLDNKFGSDEDIVHKIGECIQILEVSPTPSTRSTPSFNKKQALRLLIHLVGDIHQPLHVGSGYYDLFGPTPKLIEDPGKASHHQTDKGANALRYSQSHYAELHSYWDDTLVEQVAHTRKYEKLALALEAAVTPQDSKGWKTSGDYHHWAEAWATDSVHEAKKAYTGIVFQSAETRKNGKLKLIYIRLPEDYEAQQLPRASEQLTKAAFHLAALLNSIQWK